MPCDERILTNVTLVQQAMPESVYLLGRGDLSGFRLPENAMGWFRAQVLSLSLLRVSPRDYDFDDEVIARFQTLHQKARAPPSKGFETFSQLRCDQGTGMDEEGSQCRMSR